LFNQHSSFHIVAPSLPKYGFSQGVSHRGFAQNQYAETCHRLMLQLGYNEYVMQGGGWGFMVTRVIGLLYPQHCKPSHVSLVRESPPTWRKHPLPALQHALTPYMAKEKEGLDGTAKFRQEGKGS
jgi:pimeloyl-ACP methyl ester carboxylesterase